MRTSPSNRRILKLRLLILSVGELGKQLRQLPNEETRSNNAWAMLDISIRRDWTSGFVTGIARLRSVRASLPKLHSSSRSAMMDPRVGSSEYARSVGRREKLEHSWSNRSLSVSAARAECVLLLSLAFVRDPDERIVQSIGLRRCSKRESTEQPTLGISISVLCDGNAVQEMAEGRVELIAFWCDGNRHV